jgi:uncharacterized membrane protein YdbT with pleckstrin-like domain
VAASTGRVAPAAHRDRVPWHWHPDRIVASYLRPGERLVLRERRSRRAWLVEHAWLLAVGVLASAGLAALGSTAAIVAGLVVLASVCAYLGVQGTRAWFTRYVITDLRVLRVSGVLRRHAEFIPWSKVTDVGLSVSVVQHLVGSATIRIESANERSGFRAMTDVVQPDRFYQCLVEMVDRKQGRVPLEDRPPAG